MIPYERKAWFRLLVSLRGSFVHGVPTKVLLFGAIGLLVWWYDTRWGLGLRIPVGFHEVAGLVIGLILAFRSNTAYARFWEGRTLWGGIVNASRNLARIAAEHARLTAEGRREFNAWIVAFAYCASGVLRRSKDLSAVAGLLPADQYAALQATGHPALFCAQRLSQRIADLVDRKCMEPVLAMAAERQVSTLVDCLGGSERISRTPTPLPYVLLVERSVVLYLGSLPFGLVSRLGWWTPLVTMAVAYLVLTIELVGDELDDPFDGDPSDVPLEEICQTIAGNLLGQSEAADP